MYVIEYTLICSDRSIWDVMMRIRDFCEAEAMITRFVHEYHFGAKVFVKEIYMHPLATMVGALDETFAFGLEPNQIQSVRMRPGMAPPWEV